MTRFFLIVFLFASISAFAQKGRAIDNRQQFLEFLKNSLKDKNVNAETSKIFRKRSMEYWKRYMLDYNQNSDKYDKELLLFYQNQEKYKQNNLIQIDRFEKEIEKFRRFDLRNTFQKKSILFIGSSSIVHWETAVAFPEFNVINRGFGGASIPEIIHYYPDIIKKYSPSILIVYCDIDIERGRSPNKTVDAYKKLIDKVRADFPQLPIVLLSMKPTLIDDFLGKDVRKNKIIANNMLSQYCSFEKNLHYVDITKVMIKPDGSLHADIFLPDGMHMNKLGYTLWNPIIRNKIISLNNN